MKFIRILGYILVVALLIGGVFIYNKAKNLQDPEFLRLENIKFKNVTLPPNLKATFASDAVINNPNPHSLTISKVVFDVLVDGKKATHFEQVLEKEMPANSQFSLPLDFEIPFGKKDFFKNVKDMLGGAWKKQSFKVRSVGTFTIRAARVQFDIPFDYEDEYRLEDYL